LIRDTDSCHEVPNEGDSASRFVWRLPHLRRLTTGLHKIDTLAYGSAMRALLISIACVAAIGVCALGSVEATQLDESTGFPVRDLGNVHKGVCVTYTIGEVTTQLAVPYPNAMTYHVIGNSGGYWLYYGSQRLHVDSLVLGPLYVVPPSEFPESCTAAE